MRRRLATQAQRIALYILQDGKCSICGQELTDDFQVDHIKPWAEQGKTELWNLQALHMNCHRSKTSLGQVKRTSFDNS